MTAIMIEGADGTRRPAPDYMTPTIVDAIVKTGKFITRLRTDTLIVIRLARLPKGQVERVYKYGGRTTPKNPNGYRGG